MGRMLEGWETYRQGEFREKSDDLLNKSETLTDAGCNLGFNVKIQHSSFAWSNIEKAKRHNIMVLN